jgi:hypothetical protein
MTVHTTSNTSGNDHDTFHESSGFDPSDESQFNEMLAKWDMEPIKAYARVARRKRKVSKVAEDKRKYRAQRKADGFGQYVVEVPVDDDAKHTVYAVAQAIVGDKDDIRKLRSTILSVVSNPALLRLAELISSSEIDVSLIVDLIESGDWDEIAAIRAAYPSLLDQILHLMKARDTFISVLDCLVRHADDSVSGSAKGLLDAAVVANGCPEVIRFLEVRQEGGLRGRLLGWVLGRTQ